MNDPHIKAFKTINRVKISHSAKKAFLDFPFFDLNDNENK